MITRVDHSRLRINLREAVRRAEVEVGVGEGVVVVVVVAAEEAVLLASVEATTSHNRARGNNLQQQTCKKISVAPHLVLF